MASYPRCERIVRRRTEEAAELFPRLRRLRLRFRWDAGRRGRRFAYCDSPDPLLVTLSPRLEDEPAHRIEGVVRHELGHAIDGLYARATLLQRLGELASTPERRADDIAHAVWGDPILYDGEDVQSVEVGLPGRPGWLPS